MKGQSHVKTTVRVFRLLAKEEPGAMALVCFYWLSTAVISGLEIWASNFLYQALFACVDSRDFSSLLLPVGLCALISLSGVVSGCFSDRYIELKLPDRISNVLSRRFFQHASEIEYRYFDSEDYYNGLTRAKKVAQGTRAYQYVLRVFRILGFSLEIVSQVAAVVLINPFLLVLAFFSVLPVAVVRVVRGKYFFVLQHYQTSRQNTRDYLWKLLCSKNGNRDLQLYGASSYFIEKWQGLAEELRGEENRFMQRSTLIQLGTNTIKAAGYFCALLFSGYLLLSHQIELGLFVTCISVFANMQQRFEQILMFSAMMPGDTRFFEDYFNFLSYQLPERPKECEKASVQRVSLEKVSYQYSGQQEQALKEVSFSVEKGEVIAVVGENGAGKSTLTKLLLGLYEPQEGLVCINGKPFSEWDREDFYRRTAVIYQDYMRYELTLRENIGFGDLQRLGQDEALFAAAEQARIGETVRGAAQGLDTWAGRQFGEMELSGGQWQRLAIARGFVKSDSEFVLVDEPTASIDPVAESNAFQDIVRFVQGRAAVLITHRIGIARMANKIVVMEKGQIVETGTHQELMEQQGVYYRLFMLQAKWYEM